MTPDRWQKIEELFHSAREREEGQRVAFLDEACAGDEVLRREIESLLAEEKEAKGFLESPALQMAARKMARDQTRSLVGEQLGPYKIEAALGAGGMGEVYRARDTRLHRTVAIKIAKENFTERFEREARAIAALNHPNICTLYDVGPNYLVMEYLTGQRPNGPVPVAIAVGYITQICDALAVAHAQGIIHRDLKPANIIITKNGPKVLDFGLAKHTKRRTDEIETLSESFTQPGEFLGTPAYMAPEQIEGHDVDARTDVFALGCVLYELLSGKQAFQGKSTASLISAVLKEEPRPLSEVAPQVPASVERVVGRCLAKNPDARWQDVRDLKYSLEDASQVPAAKAAPRRSRWLAAVATGVLLIAFVWFSYSHLRSTQEAQVLRLRIGPPPGAEFFRSPNRGGIALSPDGRLLAFSAIRDGQMRLWIQPLDSSSARELPGTEGAYCPFWSPDNRSLGFFAGGRLKRIDAEGGNLQVLCNVLIPRGATWNREGVIVFADVALYTIKATGGTPVPLTAVDASRLETGHAAPRFLADGRHFLYDIASANPQNAGVYVGLLDDPKMNVRIGQVNSWALPARAASGGADYLLWARGDMVVAQNWNPSSLQFVGEPVPIGGPVGVLSTTPELTVSQNGLLVFGPPVELQLTWFDRNGRALGTVGEPELGIIMLPRVSPDGQKIAALHGTSGTLFVTDLARKTSSRLVSEARGGLAWSPDSSEVAFDASDADSNEIVLRMADGSGTERRPVASGRNQHLVGWMPNSESLLYYDSNPRNSRRELWIMSLRAQSKPRLVRSNPYREPEAAISPDGQWLAYASDENGRLEVYLERFGIEPLPREHRWQVSSNGGNFPRWRRDGKELFYTSADGDLMSVGIRPRPGSLELTQPQALFPLPTIYYTQYSYDVAPDGKRFLVAAPSSRRGREPLSVVVNWPSALRANASD